MSEAPLILVVDDDSHIAEVIVFALTSAGFRTVAAASGEDALKLFHEHKPALAILDINLPGRDGLWVCQEIRRTSQAPILFLSARDEEVDRVMGLTIGGDDYVTKPFSPRELVARVQVILRRLVKNETPTEKSHLSVGLLTLDLDSLTAAWSGRSIELTRTEFDLLKAFINRPSKTFTRDELLTQVYADTVVSDRTIDSHILHIRKKFAALGGRDLIQTQHGVGYKLGACAQ